MTDAAAFSTEGIDGVTVSDDGSHAFFKFKSASTDLTVAMPAASLMNLISSTSHAFSKAQKIVQSNQVANHVFQTERWEIASRQDGKNLVISFQLPGGAKMSYQISRNAAAFFHEALGASLAAPTSSAPGKVTN